MNRRNFIRSLALAPVAAILGPACTIYPRTEVDLTAIAKAVRDAIPGARVDVRQRHDPALEHGEVVVSVRAADGSLGIRYAFTADHGVLRDSWAVALWVRMAWLRANNGEDPQWVDISESPWSYWWRTSR